MGPRDAPGNQFPRLRRIRRGDQPAAGGRPLRIEVERPRAVREPRLPPLRPDDSGPAARRRVDRRARRVRSKRRDAGPRAPPPSLGPHGGRPSRPGDAARVLRGQRSRARPHRRGALENSVLEEHGRLRRRGRRAERAGPRRLSPRALPRDLTVQPAGDDSSVREHDRRPCDDRRDSPPPLAVAIRPLRNAARRDLRRRAGRSPVRGDHARAVAHGKESLPRERSPGNR